MVEQGGIIADGGRGWERAGFRAPGSGLQVSDFGFRNLGSATRNPEPGIRVSPTTSLLHCPTISSLRTQPKLAVSGCMARTSRVVGPDRRGVRTPLKVLVWPAKLNCVSSIVSLPWMRRAVIWILSASQSPPGSMGQPQTMMTLTGTSISLPSRTSCRVGRSSLTVKPWISRMTPSPSTS